VDDRTRQVIGGCRARQGSNATLDEKRKTDELLYEMLPKYVAEQLKQGKKVSPPAAPRPCAS
jgi:hypothetical protein